MRRLFYGFAVVICLIAGLSSCDTSMYPENSASDSSVPGSDTTSTAQATEISQIAMLESGFSSASFSGDDGFETFLAQDGADSDAAVTRFLAGQLSANIQLTAGAPGCSTLVVPGANGGALFGRNFDWQNCDALVLTSKPTAGYVSISTVNLGSVHISTSTMRAKKTKAKKIISSLS